MTRVDVPLCVWTGINTPEVPQLYGIFPMGEPFRNAATYHVTDPIENVSLTVTLRKKGTQGERSLDVADWASSTSNIRRRDSQAGNDDGSDNEAMEQEKKPLRIEREEAERLVCPPRTFRWQEKAFSPAEVAEIRRQDAGLPRRLWDRSGVGSLLNGDAGQGTARFWSISNHHRKTLSEYERAARLRGEDYNGETIFTRVNSE